MKHIILHSDGAFNKNFKIGGINIPRFGAISNGLRFHTRADAQLILDTFFKSQADDCIIARDIWNID